MDNILLQIDNLIETDYSNNKSELIDDLSVYIQHLFEIEKNIPATLFLFSKETEKSIQRFISICFIRLIGNKNFSRIAKYKHQIYKLIQEALPDLCTELKISEKTDTYEKERILRDFIISREKEFDDLLVFRDSITELNLYQQNFRRIIYARKNIMLILFTDSLLNKSHLDKIFNRLNEYIEAPEELKFQKYNSALEIIPEYIDWAKDIGTKYSVNYISKSFENIKAVLNKDVENSPYYLPATLFLKETEKKYPFISGTKSAINIEIINNGKGYAQNVSLKIISYNKDVIIFSSEEQFVGNIKLEPIVIEFEYEVLKDIQNILLEIELKWSFANGQVVINKSEINFQAQASNIDWEEIKLLEPYNLEPVETDSELIGRDVILQKLKGMLSLPVGSSYIFGQRRVGKTSIVKTLLNSNQDGNLLIYYVEAGDWNDANSALHSMNNLGEKICKKIKRHNTKFGSLAIPAFDGSFNKVSDFIDEVLEIDKEFKLIIILDEFDRISRNLYERGEIGKSFGLTLRSISNRTQCGFILVGGEKLEYILSQWQEFNKFSPIRVDYFSKERDWEDFKKLIKKPVESLLEISDGAITLIYEETAGNPYFTKKICMELFRLMVNNRDIHVTQKEMLKATLIARSSSNIGATDFSHFWEDGIKGKVEKEEETSLKRRKILIAITYILNSGKSLTKSRIFDFSFEMGLANTDVEKYLLEFEQRKIMIYQNDQYDFVVKFFKDWLLAGGVDKIIASFEEEQRVSIYQQLEENTKIKSEEIHELIPKLKTFKGSDLTVAQIRSWLDQFDDIFDQRIIFKLLQNFKLYTELEIRTKLESLFSIVRSEFSKRGIVRILDIQRKKRNEILVTSLDKSPAKGSSYFTKLFADTNNIYTENVCFPDLIQKKILDNPQIKCLIIIDDFIGSGNTIITNVRNYFDVALCKLLNDKNIFILIGAITGFVESKEKIEEKLTSLGIDLKIIIVDILNETDKCFNNSLIFSTPAEEKKAKGICLQKGELLEPRFPLGYSNCESLIAFPMNCPNNTLPIFWKETPHWTPLFKRN